MEKLEIKNRWHQIKPKMKQVYAQLSDEDLKYVEGREEEFLSRLEQKTGKQRDELVKWINRL